MYEIIKSNTNNIFNSLIKENDIDDIYILNNCYDNINNICNKFIKEDDIDAVCISDNCYYNINVSVPVINIKINNIYKLLTRQLFLIENIKNKPISKRFFLKIILIMKKSLIDGTDI